MAGGKCILGDSRMIGYGDEEDDDGERKSDEDEEDEEEEEVQVFGSSLQRGSAKHMGA